MTDVPNDTKIKKRKPTKLKRKKDKKYPTELQQHLKRVVVGC